MNKMVEMFAKCPVCKLELMIVWDSGKKLCTECGFGVSNKK